MLGTIHGSPALLTAERAAFPSDINTLEAFHAAITKIENLGENDIYRWYLASSGITKEAPADLKINLIYPCTEKHIKKYSPQTVRMVTETPAIYQQHVRPYMLRMRDEGRLNWVFNIIEGRKEQEDILLRDPGQDSSREEAFLLAPDLNWDRKTLSSLHLLVLVDRRDIWSLRDLKKSHVNWIKHMREKILDATVELYPELEKDMLKLYIHCMPVLDEVSCLMHLTKIQISPLTTIFTSTLFTSCAKPQARNQSAKLSASKISSRSWRPWLVVQKPAWQTSVSPIISVMRAIFGEKSSFH